MDNQYTENKKIIVDDEIDLVELIRFIWSKWKIWVTTSVIGLVISVIYVSVTPPIYESSATFFVPNDGSSSALNKYASFLGAGSGSGELENQVMAIFESERLKWQISESLFAQFPELFFDKVVTVENNLSNVLTHSEKIEIVKSFLGFEEQFVISQNKSGLFQLKYQNKSTELSLFVVDIAINQVARIYNELEIGATKSIITILDKPSLKKDPVKPKKIPIVLISLIISGILGLLFCLVKNLFESGK